MFFLWKKDEKLKQAPVLRGMNKGVLGLRDEEGTKRMGFLTSGNGYLYTNPPLRCTIPYAVNLRASKIPRTAAMGASYFPRGIVTERVWFASPPRCEGGKARCELFGWSATLDWPRT